MNGLRSENGQSADARLERPALLPRRDAKVLTVLLERRFVPKSARVASAMRAVPDVVEVELV